jgi:Flp pilus assembly CpaF family ATPase
MPTPTLDLILPHLPSPLQEAILCDHYSEICVCENGLVFGEVAGHNSMEELLVPVPTQDQLRKAVNAIARLISRREADEQNPILEARLPDGSRVAGNDAAHRARNHSHYSQVSAELVYPQ